ncbi:glycerol-3-phosphate dehydrogenase, partial [Salinicoccus roseus]|uniref:glycerol-3-phosphate dehydrogenase C-terminal domain-containing protein n=1 Tax=Salinicoccus roseus TaxID=45670 RepID=UPI0029305EB8
SEHYGLPKDVHAKVIYSIQHEMAANPRDYFVRRTGELYFDIARVEEYKDGVIQLMSDILDWDDSTRQTYKDELEVACREAKGTNTMEHA